MDLLLDPSAVSELCAPPTSPSPSIVDAVGRCKAIGGRVWLYAGALDLYLRALTGAEADGATGEDESTAPTMRREAARQRLLAFAEDKHWLAALGADIGPDSSGDAEIGQFLRAAERIGLERIRVLTGDPTLLSCHPSHTIDAASYLAEAQRRRSIDFIDLAAQQARIRAEAEAGLHRVLHHGRYVMGPEIGALERRLADYVGVEHCIAVSSGTDALLVALMALGVGPGDEVITTPFTFVATAEVIALCGAAPRFVDIDPRTYNIDPALIESAIGPTTKAIIPIALFGQCADMDAINAIAARHGLPVVEDAAQSFGATYKGRRSGGLSTIGCTSFFPAKPLGCYGDGGACFTNDRVLAATMRQIMNHGQDGQYRYARLGINGRLDSMQAAILLAKMAIFDDELARRARAADAYGDALGARGACTLGDGDALVHLPHVEAGNTSAYAQYTVQVADRDEARQRLQAAGIPSAVYYPVPLNRQGAYSGYRGPDGTPRADAAAARVLSLPMHPYLAEDQAQAAANALIPDA